MTWVWIAVVGAFVVGACLGMLLMAVLHVSRRDAEDAEVER